jgi:hypothetical protein
MRRGRSEGGEGGGGDKRKILGRNERREKKLSHEGQLEIL